MIAIRRIMFKFNEIELSVRLLEGPYPDYKQVIPDSKEYTCEIDKSELESAIKVINTFARSVLGNRTDFDIDPDMGRLSLSSTIIDLGSNKSQVKIYNPYWESIKSCVQSEIFGRDGQCN